MMPTSVLAIDWSGALNLTKGQLCMATVQRGQFRGVQEYRSRETLIGEVIEYCRKQPDTVIGIDFCFSMPKWYIEKLGAATFLEVWESVSRNGESWLQNCEQPFWGRKGKTKPDHCHLRETEIRLIDAQPKSIFQIAGRGAVGTGSLRGIPYLRTLREAGISIWPFDPPRLPMAVEIYPRLFTGKVKKSCANDRRWRLKEKWPSLIEEHLNVVNKSEDSFDASVSAWVMAQHLDQFGQPAVCVSAQWEGEIWGAHP